MKTWKYTLVFLLLVAICVWLIVIFQAQKSPRFEIIACDVGQGDAVLVNFGDLQILTDGGPSSKVISCLEKYMPITDRKIELVVLTHPDRDHFAGLIEVFKRYKVENFLANGFDKSTQDYQALRNAVGGTQARIIYPEDGMVIKYGLISLDVVWPVGLKNKYPQEYLSDKKVLGAISEQPTSNDFSIVTLLNYKDFDALLTGDLDPNGSDAVAKIIKEKYSDKTIEYLKVPHHGSKNGMTEELLKDVNPKVAVISDGKDNSYGHPSREILDMLTKYSISIRRTDLEGDILFTY